MNKINPLLEVMNDIDDDIVSGAAPVQRKRPRYFKPMLIAAAAVVLCGATAVTAIASIKPHTTVTLDNEEPADMEYDVYVDDQGREIRTYAIQLPDYALREEVDGYTAVGKVRAVYTDEYEDDYEFQWVLVDEEGNRFPQGINNKAVECEILDGESCLSISFTSANFNYEDYSVSVDLRSDTLDRSDAKLDVHIVPAA